VLSLLYRGLFLPFLACVLYALVVTDVSTEMTPIRCFGFVSDRPVLRVVGNEVFIDENSVGYIQDDKVAEHEGLLSYLRAMQKRASLDTNINLDADPVVVVFEPTASAFVVKSIVSTVNAAGFAGVRFLR
jgi:hypothetical protein